MRPYGPRVPSCVLLDENRTNSVRVLRVLLQFTDADDLISLSISAVRMCTALFSYALLMLEYVRLLCMRVCCDRLQLLLTLCSLFTPCGIVRCKKHFKWKWLKWAEKRSDKRNT